MLGKRVSGRQLKENHNKEQSREGSTKTKIRWRCSVPGLRYAVPVWPSTYFVLKHRSIAAELVAWSNGHLRVMLRTTISIRL